MSRLKVRNAHQFKTIDLNDPILTLWISFDLLLIQLVNFNFENQHVTK